MVRNSPFVKNNHNIFVIEKSDTPLLNNQNNASMKKICLNCNHEFEALRNDKKFCSTSCKAALWLKRKGFFQNKITKQETNILFLKVDKGDLFNSIKKAKRSEDFWIFCHAMFWHTQDFHEGEKNKFKQMISEHFKNSRDIDETFAELIERACLAKRHVEEKESRYIPQPEDWLNTNYPNGLSSTHKWFIALQKQRLHSPDFNKGLSLFAEAVASYADTRNILDIVFYRQVFISLTHYDLLQWYMNVIMHYQFIDF